MLVIYIQDVCMVNQANHLLYINVLILALFVYIILNYQTIIDR